MVDFWDRGSEDVDGAVVDMFDVFLLKFMCHGGFGRRSFADMKQLC